MIGEGVTVLDGVHICEGAAIAPGSVVTPRKTVGSGEVWAGIPARKVRTLSAAEKEEIRKMCSDLTEVGARKRSDAQSANLHAEETAKDYKQLIVDAADAEDRATSDIHYAYNPTPNGVKPHSRGLIYDRLPPEFDDPEEAPAVVHRPDANELRDLKYDVVQTDEEEYAKLAHLPDFEVDPKSKV